jgi:K+-sensing histidine kinase KdpD
MGVALALFVGVSILEWFNDVSGHAIAVLYVLPIALLAVAFGLRGGLVAAAAGFALFAVFEVLHSSGDIDADGWVVRAVAMFLLGGLLGRATDQAVASEAAALAEQRRRHQLEESNHRYGEAMEISDSLLQQMVAAKWMVEQGRSDQAVDVLTATIERGEQIVAALLPKRVSVPPERVPVPPEPSASSGDDGGRSF